MNKAEEYVKSNLEEQMKEGAENIVNSFYHKEIEEIAEYVGVSFLYKYQDYFNKLILSEQK